MENTKHDNNVIKKCTECNSIIQEDNIKDGFVVCFDCGTTFENDISTVSEWRQYTENSNIQSIRCSFSTHSIGSDLSNSKKLQFHQWNYISSKQRHLNEIYEELKMLDLPAELLQHAFNLYTQLYNKMLENNSTKRCSLRQGLKAACIYFSYKQLHIPIEKKNIAILCSTTNKIVTKGCNYFLNIMGQKFIDLDTFTAFDFIPKYCSLLNIDNNVQDFITQILTFIQNNEKTFDDLQPTSIVCACIFYIYYIVVLFSIDNTKIDNVNNICGISLNIIKKNINVIEKYKDYIIDLYNEKYNGIPNFHSTSRKDVLQSQ